MRPTLSPAPGHHRRSQALLLGIALAAAMSARLAAAHHLDFEPDDAYFSGDTYYEGGKSYGHDDASNNGSYTKGLGAVAASGVQGMWLRVPGNPAAVQDPAKMSRREWYFGSMTVNTNIWYRYSVRFNQEHQVTAWYGTILNQVRYSGAGYGFNLGIYLNKGSDPSGPIPLAYRYMEGNTADGASYDSGIKATGFSFQRDRWYDVLVNFYLDTTSARTGFFHVWVDGQQVVNQNNIGNQKNTNGKIRLGQYGRVERQNRHVHFDDFRQGNTLEEVGGGAAPEMDVQGNGVAIADGDATPSLTDHTDFGSTPVDGGTITRTFTVRNTGTASLNLTGNPRVAVGGDHAADFTVTAQPSTPVAADGSTTFQVAFDPAASGTRSATLAIANNDSNENPYNFSIQGNGTTTAAPEIEVQGNGVAIADGDGIPSLADHTDFDSAAVDGGSVTRTFTVRNLGDADLSLTGSPRVVVGGDHTAEFTLTAIPATPVSPAGSTTFQITFDPAASGIRSATLAIANNDADENPYNFSIQGTGAATEAPAMDVQGNDVTIADGDATPTLVDHTDFGSAAVAGGAVTRTFTVRNTGTAPLHLTGSPKVAIGGAQAADFAVVAAPSSPVAAGGSTTFQVTFDPVATGIRSATLAIPREEGAPAIAIPTLVGADTYQDPNVPANTVDDNFSTRWSAEGSGRWIAFDLGETSGISSVQVAWYQGNTRRSFFAVETSDDGAAWAQVFDGQSSGTTLALESYPVAWSAARYFRIVGFGNSSNAWNSIVEVRVGARPVDNSNPYDFAIRGQGSASPEIEVRGNGVAIADGDATPSPADYTDFGSTAVVGGNVVRIFTVHNLGDAPLNLTGAPIVELTGAHAGDFAVVVLPATPVAAGNATTFQVAFDPSADGIRTATVAIANDDADENPHTYAIQGDGTTAATFDVVFVAGPGGLVDGATAVTQTVATGTNCVPVAAQPFPGFRFVNWSGDLAGTDNPLAVNNVQQNMTVTANFAEADRFTVVFVAFAGGTVDGVERLTQTVASGQDCTPVAAAADPGWSFAGWSGDADGTDNPLTVAGVIADLTVVANFAADERVAAGSLFTVTKDEAGVAQFTRAPKVWGRFCDPVKDPFRMKPKKASAKVRTKIAKGETADSVAAEWTRKVRLCNLKAFKGEQKIGTGAVAWLAAHPVIPLNLDLHAAGKEDGAPYSDPVRTLSLSGPLLDAIRNDTNVQDLTEAGPGFIILLLGRWFGAKPPKAWLEYQDPATGARKCLRLKVVKPYAFTNAAGKPAASVMDPATGESRMLVQVPSMLLPDVTALVLDNGVGLAARDFAALVE